MGRAGCETWAEADDHLGQDADRSRLCPPPRLGDGHRGRGQERRRTPRARPYGLGAARRDPGHGRAVARSGLASWPRPGAGSALSPSIEHRDAVACPWPRPPHRPLLRAHGGLRSPWALRDDEAKAIAEAIARPGAGKGGERRERHPEPRPGGRPRCVAHPGAALHLRTRLGLRPVSSPSASCCVWDGPASRSPRPGERPISRAVAACGSSRPRWRVRRPRGPAARRAARGPRLPDLVLRVAVELDARGLPARLVPGRHEPASRRISCRRRCRSRTTIGWPSRGSRATCPASASTSTSRPSPARARSCRRPTPSEDPRAR